MEHIHAHGAKAPIYRGYADASRPNRLLRGDATHKPKDDQVDGQAGVQAADAGAARRGAARAQHQHAVCNEQLQQAAACKPALHKAVATVSIFALRDCATHRAELEGAADRRISDAVQHINGGSPRVR